MNSSFPDHWIDVKHEFGRASRGFLVTSEVIEGEGFGTFNVGFNDGADLFRREMDSLESQAPRCWSGTGYIGEVN